MTIPAICHLTLVSNDRRISTFLSIIDDSPLEPPTTTTMTTNHAQAEALVQRAQQLILDMDGVSPDNEPPN